MQSFQYQFAVANGTYAVNLKFAENYATAAGQRSFNVIINGQTVLTNFDIFAAAGGGFKALDRGFSASVTNGQMIIQLVPVIGAAKIDAVELVLGGSVSTSTSTSNTPGHRHRQ